jgi:hypothetical protein
VTPEQMRGIVSRAVDYGRSVVAAQQCQTLVQSAACQLVALEAELSRYVLRDDIAGIESDRAALLAIVKAAFLSYAARKRILTDGWSAVADSTAAEVALFEALDALPDALKKEVTDG